MPHAQPLSFDYLLLRFIVYAFLGWIIESSYKTIGQRRGFINSGFLHGPLIPIYGFGALIMIVLGDELAGLPLAPRGRGLHPRLHRPRVRGWASLYETIFKIKLWDYSKKRFNIQGRICLKNTLLWALLVLAFVLYIEPAVDRLVARLPSGPAARWAAYAIGVIALADAAWSTFELKSTAELLRRFHERFALADPDSARRAMRSLSGRFLAPVPASPRARERRLPILLRRGPPRRRLRGPFSRRSRPPSRATPRRIPPTTRPCATSSPRSTCGPWREPRTTTARSSTTPGRSRGSAGSSRGASALDAASAARGGLLHDFFLYDWRREGKVKAPRDRPREDGPRERAEVLRPQRGRGRLHPHPHVAALAALLPLPASPSW